jgi:hypothetical protein
MPNIRHLKRLEDLQTENKQLIERLSELAAVIASLKLAEALAALRPPAGRSRKSPRRAMGVARPITSARCRTLPERHVKPAS